MSRFTSVYIYIQMYLFGYLSRTHSFFEKLSHGKPAAGTGRGGRGACRGAIAGLERATVIKKEPQIKMTSHCVGDYYREYNFKRYTRSLD